MIELTLPDDIPPGWYRVPCPAYRMLKGLHTCGPAALRAGEALLWIHDHIHGRWHLDLLSSGWYDVYFENLADATFFKLRWYEDEPPGR